MKHRIFGKKLGRNTRERKALFNSLTRAIFTHGYFQTTEAKAKSVVRTIEHLSNIIMTKSELDSRRELFRYLQDRNWVNNVVETMKVTFEGQTSNFTKRVKIKRRYGDDALVVKMSFVKPISFSSAPAIKAITPKETKKVETKVKAKAITKKVEAKVESKVEAKKAPAKKVVKKVAVKAKKEVKSKEQQ